MKWEGGEANEVQVTLADGQQFVLRGRAATLVEFIAAMAADLDAAEFATLTFELAGDVKPRMERRWPAIKERGKKDASPW